MEAVIDSVSMNHILRTPKKRKQKKDHKSEFETCLDKYLKSKGLIIFVDSDRGLISEWEETCGVEVIAVVITKWEEYGAILFVENLLPFEPRINKKLRQLGFTDTVDKLILKIALTRTDCIIVSDDGDFWDPSLAGQKGIDNACVAKLCREELNITVMLLSRLIRILSQ